MKEDLQEEFTQSVFMNAQWRELETTRKKLKVAELALETKQEHLTCYLCLSKMKLPLQICKTGHFACASCLSDQMISCRKVRLIKENKFYSLHWNIDFKCGLCKKPAYPRYAGPFVSQLIEPNPDLTCPKCKKLFQASKISMHVLVCDYNAFNCKFCHVKVESKYLRHVNRDCNQIHTRNPKKEDTKLS